MTVSGDRMTVTPDPAFLTDPTTTLPLIIDPTVSRTNWSMINSTFPTQCYVMCNGYDNASNMKVGWTNVNQSMVYRSMVSFSPSTFDGTHVLDAKLRSRLIHSWNLANSSCQNHTTNVHSVGSFSASTTWNNHASTWSGALAATTTKNCNDAAGVYSEWGSAGLTSYVNSRAAANGTVFLGLAGTGSSSTMGGRSSTRTTPS